MKYRMYSKKKIDSVVKKHGKENVTVGMRNDWFWTAEDYSEDWDVILGKYYRIGGIPGSYCDSPVASISQGDNELLIDVWVEVDEDEAGKAFDVARKKNKERWDETVKRLKED